ncbi:MAG TPA: non-canonical purine NTP pyrophosphatase [Anaerolineaceae bacterium]|nr:non-canonical purine NTP pyrophosphatase [Anaerolineaceae bacterium]HPN53148.1 non-canonical purine NTP pyrophosphatase [Anaerolineaceae bacterium]
MDGYVHLTYITGNELKYKVAVEALRSGRIRLERQALDTPEIQSEKVEEIAAWSAIWASGQLKKPVVVTDAGYAIEALNGFPGPFIKYVNGWFSSEDYLNLMQGKENRRIVVSDCLAYCRPGEEPVLFTVRHEGRMADKPGQSLSSPIDRLYIPEGYDLPTSDMAPEDVVAYWSRETPWQALKQYLLEQI